MNQIDGRIKTITVGNQVTITRLMLFWNLVWLAFLTPWTKDVNWRYIKGLTFFKVVRKKNEFPRDTFSLLAIKAFRKSLFFFSAGTTWQKLTLIRLDILKVAFFGGRGGGEGGGGEGGDCPLRISRRTNPILTKLYTIINNFKSLQWKNKFIYVLPMSLQIPAMKK